MLSFEKLATPQVIAPGIVILILFVLVLANLVPASPLAPGTVLYEKNNFGYQPVVTTEVSNMVRLHRQAGAFVQIGINNPPAKLWVPAQALTGRYPLPAQLFLRTHAGQLDPTLPPFVEKQLTIHYGHANDPATSKQTSVHFLFSLFLLSTLLLVMKSQTVKNTLAVLAGCFMLFYSVYASGLVKTTFESPQAGIIRILDLVRTGKGMTIACESEDLRKIVQSRHGNNIESGLLQTMPAGFRGYLLTRRHPGNSWKLLATDGKVMLFYRD